MLPHLIVTITVGGTLYYYSHFPDEKTEPHKTGTVIFLSLLSYLRMGVRLRPGSAQLDSPVLAPSHGPRLEEQTVKGKWIRKALWELPPALYMLMWFGVLSGLRAHGGSGGGFPSPGSVWVLCFKLGGWEGIGSFCDLEYVDVYE